MTGCDNWLMDEMKPRRASTERLHCDVVSGSQWTIDFTVYGNAASSHADDRYKI